MLIGGRDCESRLTSVFLVGCSEDELAAHFGRFGELSQVHVVLDKTTKRSKGLAYILYMFPEAAVRYSICNFSSLFVTAGIFLSSIHFLLLWAFNENETFVDLATSAKD
jgi:hypothetical protein